jgi:hypothetical protein
VLRGLRWLAKLSGRVERYLALGNLPPLLLLVPWFRLEPIQSIGQVPSRCLAFALIFVALSMFYPFLLRVHYFFHLFLGLLVFGYFRLD